MRYSASNGLLWLFIYFILALIPMGIALAGDLPELRTFWIEFGVALGFVGLSVFALQFLFSGRFKQIAPVFGNDNILNFHRQIGIVAFLLILAHPVTLLIADPSFISYFDPTDNFFRALALSFVSAAIFLITITSIWRINFGLQYEHWRMIHGLLALAIVFIGTVHAIQVGHYLEPLWKKIAVGVLMASMMYLVVHTRFVRPWLNRKKPYRITSVTEELGDSWTINLEAIYHERMQFKPGQFAWITIGPTPFSLQQHPFTFSSSPRTDLLSFTAKGDGDFTARWKQLEVGTHAYLEGPFGSFVPEPDANLFLIMGGIGITPAMSMLRTLCVDKDPRQAILLYANQSYDDITFREELDELSQQINLKIVHVLDEPDDDWEGEKGFITKDLLKKYLPENPQEFMYFLCGPAPMMDMAGIGLHDLGIAWNHIYMERFQIV